MVSYINAPYYVAFDIERGSHIASNFHSMKGFAVDGRNNDSVKVTSDRNV
jgi:hypothetical protein